MRKHPLLAIAALMGFVCAALFGFAPATPRGVQCPTAPVQAVVARDCCGRVVRRAPRLGDRAFVQCACAERKAETVKATVGSKLDLLLPSVEPLTVAAIAPVHHTIPRFEVAYASASLVPPTPPPA